MTRLNIPALVGTLLLSLSGCAPDVPYTELDDSRTLESLSEDEEVQLVCDDHRAYIGREYGIDEWWRARCLAGAAGILMMDGEESGRPACESQLEQCLAAGPPSNGCLPSILAPAWPDFEPCGVTVGEAAACASAEVDEEMRWLDFDCATSLLDDWEFMTSTECRELIDRCE